jgi:hypothetical protein
MRSESTPLRNRLTRQLAQSTELRYGMPETESGVIATACQR